MSWVEELLPEYRKYRRELSRQLRGLDVNMLGYENDKTQISSMIRSMTNDIQWMETGNDPLYSAGVHVDSIYKNIKNMDMDLMPDIMEQLKEDSDQKELRLTKDEKILLKRIFASLSDRECECYLLHEGHMLSMNAIAKKLGIGKSTVQHYVENARVKVRDVVGS